MTARPRVVFPVRPAPQTGRAVPAPSFRETPVAFAEGVLRRLRGKVLDPTTAVQPSPDRRGAINRALRRADAQQDPTQVVEYLATSYVADELLVPIDLLADDNDQALRSEFGETAKRLEVELT